MFTAIPLDTRTAAAVDQAEQDTRTAFALAVLLLALLVGGIVLCLQLAYRYIRRNLASATSAAEKIAEGDLTGDIGIAHEDEVGVLMRAIATINGNLAGMIARSTPAPMKWRWRREKLHGAMRTCRPARNRKPVRCSKPPVQWKP